MVDYFNFLKTNYVNRSLVIIVDKTSLTGHFIIIINKSSIPSNKRFYLDKNIVNTNLYIFTNYPSKYN